MIVKANPAARPPFVLPLLLSIPSNLTPSLLAAPVNPPQAHEGSLTWRLGLLSSTAFRSGPALTPFQPRILRIVAALAAAPSQVGDSTQI